MKLIPCPGSLRGVNVRWSVTGARRLGSKKKGSLDLDNEPKSYGRVGQSAMSCAGLPHVSPLTSYNKNALIGYRVRVGRVPMMHRVWRKRPVKINGRTHAVIAL